MHLKLKNLKTKALIGIHPWERKAPQEIILNISLDFAGEAASHSDQLKDTLDYDALSQKVIRLVEASEFFLVEKLAQEILQLILKEDLVQNAQVEVDKPEALKTCESVSITVRG
ncbi:MAG: dihydroneopterin aldolase [Deltaproteobacteria bacterium]|nr:dihydroneopterin aldolase [Deltaproteobacteria bacterium]